MQAIINRGVFFVSPFGLDRAISFFVFFIFGDLSLDKEDLEVFDVPRVPLDTSMDADLVLNAAVDELNPNPL